MVFIRSLFLWRNKGSRKTFSGDQRGLKSAMFNAYCTHAHMYALHAKDLARTSCICTSSDTHIRFLTSLNQWYQLSAYFLIRPQCVNQFPSRMGHGISDLSPFVWETFALDALSSGICNDSLCVVLHNLSKCTPIYTGLTLLRRNKTQLRGNWAEWCNPSMSEPFKQQLQWVSVTVNWVTLGWISIVQAQELSVICNYTTVTSLQRAL